MGSSVRSQLELLVLGGRPIREPVAWYGPFVMNKHEEIERARRDFEARRLGQVPAVHATPTDDVALQARATIRVHVVLDRSDRQTRVLHLWLPARHFVGRPDAWISGRRLGPAQGRASRRGSRLR